MGKSIISRMSVYVILLLQLLDQAHALCFSLYFHSLAWIVQKQSKKKRKKPLTAILAHCNLQRNRLHDISMRKLKGYHSVTRAWLRGSILPATDAVLIKYVFAVSLRAHWQLASITSIIQGAAINTCNHAQPLSSATEHLLSPKLHPVHNKGVV